MSGLISPCHLKDKTSVRPLEGPQRKLIGMIKQYIEYPPLECSAPENEDVINCFETVAKKIYTDEKFRAFDKDMNDQENQEIET